MAKAIIRSPNYPTISLSEAVARLKPIHEKEHFHAAPRQSLAQDLGYKGLNGASASVLSALAKYGLLIAAGPDQFKLSKDGLDIILHHTGEPERAQAVQRAAMRPALFSDLNSAYGNELPSDHTVGVYLQKKGFNPNTVGIPIRVYRDTMEFVKTETGALDASSSQEEEQLEMMPLARASLPSVPNRPSTQAVASSSLTNTPSVGDGGVGPEMLTLSFKLSEDTLVRAEFVGRVTQEAIEKFRAFLELSKDTFPTKEQPKQTDLWPVTDDNV